MGIDEHGWILKLKGPPERANKCGDGARDGLDGLGGALGPEVAAQDLLDLDLEQAGLFV
jgi:hypothetical protein